MIRRDIMVVKLNIKQPNTDAVMGCGWRCGKVVMSEGGLASLCAGPRGAVGAG